MIKLKRVTKQELIINFGLNPESIKNKRLYIRQSESGDYIWIQNSLYSISRIIFSFFSGKKIVFVKDSPKINTSTMKLVHRAIYPVKKDFHLEQEYIDHE